MRVSNGRRGRRRLLLALVVAALVVMVAAPASANRVCWKAYVGSTGWQNKTCTGPLPLVSGWGQAGLDDDSNLPGTGWPYGWGVWVPSPLPSSDEGHPEGVLLTE